MIISPSGWSYQVSSRLVYATEIHSKSKQVIIRKNNTYSEHCCNKIMTAFNITD